MEENDRYLLSLAIEYSEKSVEVGGFPVGALVVRGEHILSEGISNGKKEKDPTSHAEISAMRKACEILDRRDLFDVTLYSSLEPCIMCLAASFWASIPKIVYACGRQGTPRVHFEGDHCIAEINRSFRRPIELIHGEALEDAALSVIRRWERR